jgi:tetratricopeptide (TPR) repeat protein
LLEQITRKFPDRLNEKVHLSELYFKNSQVAEAIQELDAIEAKVGFHAETALRKLSLLQQNGDYETALQVANKLIQNEPTNAQYYQIQYDLLQLTGRQDESVKTLENLLQYDPENGFALLSLADYYKTQGNREKSDSYLFQAFENPNVEVKDKVYIVDGLIEFVPGQAGNGQRVKKLGEILYRVHPEEASVQAVRGKLFALDSQLDSARHYLRLALEQDPSNTQAWQDLLQVDFEAQAFNHLFKDAEEALELFPNQEMFLFYFGLAARRRKTMTRRYTPCRKSKNEAMPVLKLVFPPRRN